VDNNTGLRAPDCAPAKLLVLGLGNDLLTDDAIGLHVVRRLRLQFAGHPMVNVQETTEMGLALLDFLTGYRAVLIVDSIRTGQAPPGFVHELEPASLKELTGRTPHFLGVGETLALGRLLELPMPAEVRILAIEVEDPFTLSTQLTPVLETALPGIAEQIAGAVGAMAERAT